MLLRWVVLAICRRRRNATGGISELLRVGRSKLLQLETKKDDTSLAIDQKEKQEESGHDESMPKSLC
jgi:hypothetical protein